MTTVENKSILTTVDEVLAGKQLLEQPRALLLLRMCQFCLLLAPDKTERYWQLLQPLQGKVPAELQEDLKALRSTVEEALSSGATGFTAEMLAEVKAAREMAASNIDEAKRRLLDAENRLKKRLMPFGKGPVWMALVEAWIQIDRGYALQLLKNVSAGLQSNVVARMNKARPLSPEEWTALTSSIGKARAEQFALAALEDSAQSLNLPEPVLQGVAAQLRNQVKQFAAQSDMTKVLDALQRHHRLLALHTNSSVAGQIPGLLEQIYVLVATCNELEGSWPERFKFVASLIEVSRELKVSGSDVMTPDFVARLISKTPAHVVNLAWAQGLALTAAAGQAGTAYTAVMEKTRQDPNAEAWFLVALVKRGLGSEAMALAGGSPRASALLPRLRRTWLCTHPETAGTAVSPADMAGDPIGEFLAQGSAEQRAAYLKTVTQGGTRSVPGAMWAGAGTDAEPEGVRGFWARLTAHQKSSDEAIKEYAERNPLYSSYSKITKREQQFSEALRLMGYGDYRYPDIDSALLAALVAWGNQERQQVQSVLRAMWNAIRPDDNILVANWLRNAIMARCVNVFAADAEVLTQDYLGWLKRELVEKGRQWRFGNQTVTLSYPKTAPFQFCVAAAASVGGISPERRDQILLAGLEKFEGNPALAESAAQLYNSGKEPLALQSPPQVKPNLVAGWQTGIVRNAIPGILQTLVAQAASRT